MFKPLRHVRFPSSFLASLRAFPFRAYILTMLGFLTWLPMASYFRSNIATTMFVTGPSMYPLLNTDYNRTTRKDWVLVDRRHPREGLKRGMVVSFW